MKYLTILLLFLCGCDTNDVVNFPFIVTGITELDGKKCDYQGLKEFVCQSCDNHPNIIDDCGKFQIGDTIKLCKK